VRERPRRAGFALRVAPISCAARTGTAIHFWNFMAARQKLKLFPHFSEARTAIFAIQKVE
jgi:hypothetical protein